MADQSKNSVLYPVLATAAGTAVLLSMYFGGVSSPGQDVVIQTRTNQPIIEAAGPGGGYVTRGITDVHGNRFICDDFAKSSADKFCNKFQPGSEVMATVKGTGEGDKPRTIKSVVEVLKP